ncbi:MAG: hypothetical protein QOD00_20 [Blastocatellia bacterium]|nr:hypothetical protein [Blastocatellia bacterium]
MLQTVLAEFGDVFAQDAQGLAQVILFYQEMVSGEGRERADADACAGQDSGYARHVADHVPVEFKVERDQSKVAFDTRIPRRVPHRTPVNFIKHERHFMLVAQDHKRRIAARAQLRILQQSQPVFVTHADEKIEGGRDTHSRPA